MTEPTPTCVSCGVLTPPDAAFCQSCGHSTGPRAPDADPTVLERLRAALADRYEVEKRLGAGGMATVYLARDIRHDRRVAIKVLHPELAASVGGERFEREIKLAARLQHPHILGLYDSGAADGLLYYVMPFIEGESLRDRLDRERMLPLEDALRITFEVVDALGHAHGLGIVHRDIKPENILLSGGHALVADFGIARAVQSGAEQQKLTQTGAAIGTPMYMSPEQAMGDEVGPTADLYSLACVTYEMLTGQPPFTGANARAIMARHTMEAVPSLRVVRDAVPEEVEEALYWALAKVPADRPQTAAQFAEALGTPLGATAMRRAPTLARMTAARMTGHLYQAVIPWYRKRALVAALAALVVVLGAGTAWMMRGAGSVAAATDGLDPHDVAVLYFDDRSPDGSLRYLADGLTEALIGALGSVRELRVVSRAGAEQARPLVDANVPLDSIGRLLEAGTLVLGSVEPAGPDVRVTLRLVDGASGVDFRRERASLQLPAADLLVLRDSLASEAARLVRARLGEEIRVQRQLAGTADREAWGLVQRTERLRRQMDSAAVVGDMAAVQRLWTEGDTLAAVAGARDTRWAVPPLLRATLAYRRSRIVPDDELEAQRWITRGLAWVDTALAREVDYPDALELRGNLRYWTWLLNLEDDSVRAQRLLDSARADLERATQRNPSQAGAWSTLSHLYNNAASGTEVNYAARQALQADAFLSNADVILQRLFFTSYDLGQFAEAERWCAEGARRFPADWRFAECRLFLLTHPRVAVYDVARAWRLADSTVALAPAGDSAFRAHATRLGVAAVLARAGEVDSARRVVRRSVGDAIMDPSRDLANLAAFVYTVLGDTADAIAQLRVYLTAQPHRRAAFATDPGWWFGPIAAHPAYVRLVGTPPPR